MGMRNAIDKIILEMNEFSNNKMEDFVQISDRDLSELEEAVKKFGEKVKRYREYKHSSFKIGL